MRLTDRSGPSPDPDELRASVEEACLRLRPKVQALSQSLFASPELSLRETEAAARLTRFLRAEGFSVRLGVSGLETAFVARKRGRPGGPRVALLAEYDALPGIGHACGHNLIGSAAAGAGAALGRLMRQLPGDLLVIGTPAEETIGGKAVMVDGGVFRHVDAALMFHPSSENRVYTTSLACHSLEVLFKGRAAHAVAAPEHGVNALDALLGLFQGLEGLKRRLPRNVRMPGVIVEGGQRANIVPDRAVGRFTLRAGNLRTLRRVERLFRARVRSAARASGAKARVRSLDHPYAEMVTNRTLADVFKRELVRLGRPTVDTPRKRMGSLDMGNVSHAVPSIHPYVAIAPARVPLHSRGFARAAGGAAGRAGLDVATRALALTALEIFRSNGLLGRTRREFQRTFGRRRGRRNR